jgi:serine/threonine-protein kinase
VHRDVKPANLLLDDRGRLAVADFGIAHVADETRQLTAVGTMLGTTAYLSPEQALGETATSASDRYALAVVAFELLSGERPFQAEHPTAQARQHIDAPIPHVTDRAPHLPPAVDAVLTRGLAKDPADRPPTSGEFVEELGRALRDVAPTEPTEATQQLTRPTAPPRAPRPTRTPPPRQRRPTRAPLPEPPERGASRRRLVPVLAVVVAALAAAGTALALTSGDKDPPSRAAATSTSRSTQRTTTTRPAGTTKQPAATTPATTPATPATTPPSTTSNPTTATDGRSPGQLNDAGFALIQQDRYSDAAPLLEQSVAGFRAQGDRTSLPYAYALYNLAYALARTGREAEAVPLLEERLRISKNQQGTVRRELRRIQGKGAKTK